MYQFQLCSNDVKKFQWKEILQNWSKFSKTVSYHPHLRKTSLKYIEDEFSQILFIFGMWLRHDVKTNLWTFCGGKKSIPFKKYPAKPFIWAIQWLLLYSQPQKCPSFFIISSYCHSMWRFLVNPEWQNETVTTESLWEYN